MSYSNKRGVRLPLLFAVTTLMGSGAPVAQEQGYLEEIIVTAQKREQNIQDIPVAVTALSGEQLVEHGITDMFDLQQSAPGLIVDQSQTATTANFSIRGVGTSSQNFGLESSVGLYVDGVYRARQSAMINELADVERVEVLRGPQGTLFGRNTSSGAVLLNTVAPAHDTDGYLEMTYGNLDLFSANGAFGGSLVEDVLAVRVTGFTSSRDGFVDAVGQGSSLINDRNRQGGRAQVLYTPTHEVSLRVILDYSEIDEVCCAAATFRNNYFSFDGGPGSDALLAGRLGVPLLDEAQFKDYVVQVNDVPLSENEDSGVSAELNWDIGATDTLTSISAYRTFNTTDDADVDFNAADIASRFNRGESEMFSQEIRLTGSRGRVDYLAGAYYFTQNLNSWATTGLGRDFEAFVLNGTPELGELVDGLNLLSAFTGGLIPMAGELIPPGGSARDTMLQDHEAWAAFGQIDFQVLEQWRLSAGLRYTDEKKDLTGRFTQDNAGPAPDLDAIGTNLFLASQGLAPLNPALLAPLAYPGWGFYLQSVFAPRPDVDETLEDDQVTWNVKLSWTPNDDMLMYAGYATGFKSGGTNTDRIPAQFSQVFGAEKTNAFEVGAKLAFPQQNLRVNLALHYTTVEDFQSNAFTGTGFNLRNAGELEAMGGELEVAWSPLAGLELNGAYIYNETEFKEFEQANCWVAAPFQTGTPDPGRRNPGDLFCDRSGDRTQANPEHTVLLSATATHSFSDTIRGYIHADFNYRSSIVMDANIDPLKLQDGFGLLNARAGLVLQPFDLDISLWARNLLDEDYHGAVFDVPLQTGKLASYLREPRTYGVTLRKQF